MPENRFAGETARTYDQVSAGMFAPDVINPTVDCLAELADGGPVLEFAIGTGRVAVLLAARGVEVAGIDLSADMLAELRAKPDAASITAVEGDMATTRIDGEFSLVYLLATLPFHSPLPTTTSASTSTPTEPTASSSGRGTSIAAATEALPSSGHRSGSCGPPSLTSWPASPA